VKKHLERQFGVQKAEVSLLDGTVDVTPKEDGRIDLAHLLKATYDSGVTVAEMDMTARGRIVREPSGSLALELETSRSIGIVPNEVSTGLEALAGSEALVTVHGQLYLKPAGKAKPDPATPLRLLILEVVKTE
jgi:hypothetical protein